MQISRTLAGYSLGGADLLRRAMGKKDAEEMAKQQDNFLEGAEELGIDTKKAEAIFDLMAKFAEYGFNKSHSAAYALIAYQTAYPEGPLPGRVHGGAPDLRHGQHRQGRQEHQRLPRAGNRGAAARHQRVRALLHRRRHLDALRPGCGKKRRLRRHRSDPGSAGERAVQKSLRFLRAGRSAQGQQAGNRIADQVRRVRFHRSDPFRPDGGAGDGIKLRAEDPGGKGQLPRFRCSGRKRCRAAMPPAA